MPPRTKRKRDFSFCLAVVLSLPPPFWVMDLCRGLEHIQWDWKETMSVFTLYGSLSFNAGLMDKQWVFKNMQTAFERHIYAKTVWKFPATCNFSRYIHTDGDL